MPKSNENNYEMIVGIPSYMEADSIDYVVKQVDKGIRKYFPNFKAMIVNADNNSPDNTKKTFLETESVTPKKYVSTPKGVKGKGNNILNILKFAEKSLSKLKIIIVVDGDLKSITPEWIKFLGEPILNGFDYVLPRYSRHQFDGTITNHICYPLLYGLYGEDIRQPIGGEFAFSPRLVKHWLQQKWLPTTRQYGIDIFMSLNAIDGKYKICEAILGAKIHKASGPKLGPMFTQVVTTFFDKITSNKKHWIGLTIDKPEPKPKFGLKRLDLPQDLSVNIREVKEKLREAYRSREKMLIKLLNPYTIARLKTMFEEDIYEMNTLFWTQVVYQLLFSYDMGSGKVRKDIIEALKPLYFARSVSFNYKTWRYSPKYAEEHILHQAMAFASQRPYFLGLYMNYANKKQMKKFKI